jgi:molybdopterin-containing oxidoreductase family membrane subunit
MWFERYVIVVTSLSKDFLPSSWASYHPTITEIGIFVGTLGIFILGVLMFFRYIPMIASHEVKSILKQTSIVKSKENGEK